MDFAFIALIAVCIKIHFVHSISILDNKFVVSQYILINNYISNKITRKV